MAYVSVARHGHNVQVKRWLEEDGMRLKEYLPVHFSLLWDDGFMTNIHGGSFWSVRIVF